MTNRREFVYYKSIERSGGKKMIIIKGLPIPGFENTRLLAKGLVGIYSMPLSLIFSPFMYPSIVFRISYLINPLPDVKILDLSKLKQIAKDILKYI